MLVYYQAKLLNVSCTCWSSSELFNSGDVNLMQLANEEQGASARFALL